METKLLNICPIHEVLGFLSKENQEESLLVHRLIHAYSAYNKCNIMLSLLDKKGVGYSPINGDLKQETIAFARRVFQSDENKTNFFAYFWQQYHEKFPYEDLSISDAYLSVMRGRRQKEGLAKRLEGNIIHFTDLLKADKDKLSEDLGDYLVLDTRFPIAYYFLADKKLRRATSKYLKSRMVVEKFIYGALLHELKLTEIPVDEIKVAFIEIINKEQRGMVFSGNLWTKIEKEFTALKVGGLFCACYFR